MGRSSRDPQSNTLGCNRVARWHRERNPHRLPKVQTVRVTVDVFRNRDVILNYRFVIPPPKRLDPGHFLPGRATVRERNRNMLEHRRRVSARFPVSPVAHDDADIAGLAWEYKSAVPQVSGVFHASGCRWQWCNSHLFVSGVSFSTRLAREMTSHSSQKQASECA